MHCWSEEQLMEQTGFSGLAEHRAAHHAILAQMLQVAHRVQYGEGVEECVPCFAPCAISISGTSRNSTATMAPG